MNGNEIKKGDVFYTSWGYDQTNYDYIVVEKVSPTGKTAVCRRAVYETVGYSSQCNIQEPKAKGYGKSFRMKVAEGYNGEASLRGSYIFCGGEDSESKRFDWFSKHTQGKTYSETDSMFGH